LEVEYMEGPGAWESALTIRDCWQGMVESCERNALRKRVAEVGDTQEYALGANWAEEPGNVATRGQLLAEADQLAE
jgi:hypothetical protein